MSSIIVRFPDGTKEFRYPTNGLKEGDHGVNDHAATMTRSSSGDKMARKKSPAWEHRWEHGSLFPGAPVTPDPLAKPNPLSHAA